MSIDSKFRNGLKYLSGFLAIVAISSSAFAQSDSTVVFNEIMYHPATNETQLEWVELHNLMSVDMDISRWSIANGIDFTFPEGTIVAGDAYLVIASSPATIASMTGLTNVLGPFSGRLSNSGETIELRNNNDRLMDEVAYGTDGDWPVAPDGTGVSLAKGKERAATANTQNWRSSDEVGGTPGMENFPTIVPTVNQTTLISAASNWKFNDAGIDLGSSWKESAFNDAAWVSGESIFFRGNAIFPTPTNTMLAAGRTTYYFRKSFSAPTNFENVVIQLQPLIDDGAIFYLNGTEISRFNMPSGSVSYQTLATAAIGDATYGGTISIPTSALVSGVNLLAVEVHQARKTVAYPQAVSNSSPVGYWRLGESENPAIDFAAGFASPQSGAQNGNYFGLGITNFAQAGPRPGEIVAGETIAGFELNNGAPRFAGNSDGGDDVVKIIDPGVFNFATNRAFSLEAWVNGPAAQENGAAIISKGFGGGGEQYTLDVNSGKFRFYVRNNTASHTASLASSTVGPNGTWQYLVAVYDETNSIFSLYLNGESIATGAVATSLLNTSDPVSIGAREQASGTSYNLNFDGRIDEVAIYNRALTPSEILAHFNASFDASGGSGVDTNDVAFGLELNAIETIPPPSEMRIVFNEITPATNAFWIELFNSGSSTVNLEGCVLSRFRSGSTNSEFLFPAQTIFPGAALQITAQMTGLDAFVGDKFILYAPNRLRVLDAISDSADLRGRFPDGRSEWLFPDQATPGVSNHFAFHREIVINEIMYHHRDESVTNESRESWIELFNRGSNTVDLSGWYFDRGITYNFPSDKTIAPGGYLVVASDPAYLLSLYPAVDVVGPFSGKLSKSGEQIVLNDPNKNPANSVPYFDGGRWPDFADAGGSSLELRDPHSDNSKPEAWSASNESAKSSWQTYTYRGVAQTPIPGLPSSWNEFQFGLLDGAGEILLDDFSVIENPDSTAVQLIQNGAFNAGSAAHWRFPGNHRRSRVEAEQGNPGNYVLHLSASGPTEYQGNQIETTLANGLSIVDGRTYEISFRAKWLGGKSLLNTRLYFNRLQRTTQLSVPILNGTPGAQNSVFTPNIGPTYSELKNQPVVPDANEPVKISVKADDPDGISTMKLWYALEGISWNSLTMSNVSDGTFQAILPGQTAGTLVQFFVEGRDASNAVSFFPAGGTNSRALYRVKDGQAVSALRNFRVLMTQADAGFMHNVTNVLSNESLRGTVIDDEKEIFYDIGVRLKGSFVGRNVPRVGFSISFDPTEKFRGIFDHVALDRSQGTIIGQGETIAKHIASHAGNIPNMYDDLVQFIAPRAQDTSRAQLRMAGLDDIYLDSQFENGSDGPMFEVETPRFSSTTSDGTAEGIKLPGSGFVNLDIKDYGDDQETYRWLYLQSNNHTKDDYSRIITMAKTFSLTGINLEAQSRQIMDVDEWLRVFAYESLLGVSDAYFTGGNRHNFRIYVRPGDEKVLAMPWDWDSSFNKSATANVVGNDNFAKIVNLPNNLRAYYGHLYEMISTTFNTSYMTRWTQHYGALANQDFSGILNYIGSRANYVLSQLPTATTFAITSNNGNNFTTNKNQITLSGIAPISVKSIQINGVPYALDWTALTNWNLTIPLHSGPNLLNALGFDFAGAAITNATSSISIFNSSVDALSPVIVNEWMADNAAPNGVVDPIDGEFSDWIELFNPNNIAVDLSKFFLTDALSQPTKWQIPTNTTIGAKNFLLVWADGKTNLNSLDTSGNLHANFSLSKGGEEIGLFGTNGVTPESTVQFGSQMENVSQGLFSDGNTNDLFFMTHSTPRAPNILPLLQFSKTFVGNGMFTLEWEAIPAQTYRLQYKTNLSDLNWIDVGADVVATNGLLHFEQPPEFDAQRFFRVLRVE